MWAGTPGLVAGKRTRADLRVLGFGLLPAVQADWFRSTSTQRRSDGRCLSCSGRQGASLAGPNMLKPATATDHLQIALG